MRILHVFRSPVGGLFRHVRDLARAQTQMGHGVGILCSASDGGVAAETLLEQLQDGCGLGVHRAAMSRMPGLGDLSAARTTQLLAERLGVDVVHCHGAKGGVYGRLAADRLRLTSVYTPHGGSLHYRWSSPSGALFLSAEKFLANKTSGFCFVCDFERREFDAKIGLSGRPSTVVLNGLWPDDFKPVTREKNATDFLFVGEIRHLKGVDILLHAMTLLPEASLTIVGDGPEAPVYQKLRIDLGLQHRVRFAGRKPMSEALPLGRNLVLPSRNESFPYVVIEAAAAGVPLIASAVGGIAEIVPDELLCDDRTPATLAHKLRLLLQGDNAMKAAQTTLFGRVRTTCDALKMARDITDFYGRLGGAKRR